MILRAACIVCAVTAALAGCAIQTRSRQARPADHGSLSAVAEAEAPPQWLADTPGEINVRIAHMAPSSGPIARLGKDNELGARMAAEELNARKLKIGGKTARFKLLEGDDQGDPQTALALAHQAVTADVKGVVGHLNSGTSIAASKIYSDAGIPQISPSATNPLYTRQGFKTTFRILADDVKLADAMARYAVKTLKGQRIAVIDDDTPYGRTIANAFENAAEAAGGTIVAREIKTSRSMDIDVKLAAIKATDPDQLFFGGFDSAAGPALKRMKSIGLNIKLLGGDGLCTQVLADLAGDAIGEGMVICGEAGGVSERVKASMEAFQKKFKARNGIDIAIYAPYAYDALNLMASAMVKANSIEPAKYLPVLRQISYRGVTDQIDFDERGDIAGGAVTVYTYRSAKRQQIDVIR